MTALRFVGASAGSLLLHGALLAGLAVAFRPDPVPPQARPPAAIDVVATSVPRATAEALTPTGRAAVETTGPGARLGAEPISSTLGAAVAPSPIAIAGLSPPMVQVAGLPPPAAVSPVAGAGGPRVASVPAEGSAAPALPTVSAPASARAPADVALAPLVLAGRPVDALTADASAPSVDLAPAVAAALSAERVDGPSLPVIEDAATPAAAGTLAASPATPAELPTERLTAALAWTGDAATVDPKSMAAAAAFLDPGGSGADLRDRVSGALRSIDCARLQTAFDPESGALELRGHVPEGRLRAEVAEALAGQIGAAIPIRDRLKVLPRPQCGLLAMIDAVGLPQSDEQALDPRVIGDDTQVRDYGFRAGDRLVLDVTAPDYPAYVHVDYFDASGTVLHLQPNEIVPPERVAPDSPLLVGAARPDGRSLDLTIGPPFGQEIAVAFATSHPLFTELRPLSEPADVYLAELKARVADAKARHADFKGEWVYFFVSTVAGP